MATFTYTGEKSALEVRGETIHKDKPFTTENELLIKALKARESNIGDIREVKSKTEVKADDSSEKKHK